MKLINSLKSRIKEHPTAFFVITAASAFMMHLLTIGEYPSAWFDEIEIIEMGRFSVFEVNPAWSVNLMPMASGQLAPPHPYFHYLSGAVLEMLYRLTGSFIAGRIAMLLSLPLCALALLTWLRGKSFSVGVSLTVALLFLVDPNATICAHWYRPDLWCIAMILSASSLISASRKAKHQNMMLFAGGALAATSVFFWITSALLIPLVLAEFCIAYRPSVDDESRASPVAKFSFLALGAIIAASFALLPIYRHTADIVAQYLSNSELARMTTIQANPVSAFLERTRDFIKIACRSPFVWLAAAIGVFASKRNIFHTILFAATTAFILSTRVYHLRMVYLMPYLFLFAAIAMEKLLSSEKKLAVGLSSLFIAGALFFGSALSIAALNYAAWPESNTLSLFTQRLKEAMPKPAPKVCLLDFEHECYYAGRSLGWRMYSTSTRTKMLDEPYARFLDDMDAVVVSSALTDMTSEHKRVLSAHGFAISTEIAMPPAATGRLKSILAGIFYAHGYPSCEVWTKLH